MSIENKKGLELMPDPNVMNLNEVSDFFGMSRAEIVNRLKTNDFPLPRAVVVAVWNRSDMEVLKNGK
jgi:predicted DNA-binding transcriptional regulator AlpA